MRLLLALSLIVTALSTQLEVHATALTQDQMCAVLTEEFDHSFFVHQVVSNKVQLKSDAVGHKVEWYISPEKVFDTDGLTLLKLRCDNLAKENIVYHLMIVGADIQSVYRLYLYGSTLYLAGNSDTPKTHINLIKAWANERALNFSILTGSPSAGL